MTSSDDLFRGKYRTQTTRKPMFDYGWNAMYFVTMCTKNRARCFGHTDMPKHDPGHMDMSDNMNMSDRVPVEMENFPSLPVSDTTPVHGNDKYFMTNPSISDTTPIPGNKPNVPYTFIDHTRMATTPLGDTARHCWAAIPNHFPFVRLDAFVVMPNHIHGIIVIDKPHDDDADHYISMDLPGNHAGGQSQNVGSIIRGFKIGVTKFAKEHNIDFGWQPGFHDRIIQDDEGLNAVQRYIADNPLKGL